MGNMVSFKNVRMCVFHEMVLVYFVPYTHGLVHGTGTLLTLSP